ncbi:hyaluronan mediated motility receptor-like [Scomber japonicus]|uniref:hyaluronan mediated motility receptor-like n=1 Tax=Scomber japonicus TaxID=13676 RepID=UPI002305AB82|nr:hyaluronan mediated motility receptor-like [Scomber japonicus]
MSMEFNDTREQLQKHSVDISTLKREIQELGKHKERLGGNITGIEERLNITERQLREKKAQLEYLETETKGAFTETQKLLKLYKDGLSHLNSTTQDLEDKVETRLHATKTDFGAKLKEVQNNSEALSAELKEQKAEAVKFMEETGSKFRHVDEQLKIQNTSVGQQNSDIHSLKNKYAGITNRLGSVKKTVGELKPEVDQLNARVNAKVAFSATIIESKDVFTGPQTGISKILIFNKVFTNIGNAYNSKTGLFTAPRKGVYHFSFMTFGYSTYTSGAILVKNGNYQVSTWEFKGPDSSDTTSNTVILELNHKDTVNIILWKGGKINTGVFSGFLVFPTK